MARRLNYTVHQKSSWPMTKPETVRVAIAQSAPVYLNKEASLAKALEILHKASKQGVQLVAFGETWLPGYPAWLDVCPDAALWNHEPTKRAFARLNATETGGLRVGGLICWEHWMPLARMAMHNSGEHIHVAVWPTAHDLHQLASRHYAFEGRCFVLAVGLLMRQTDLPEEFATGNGKNSWLERGGSAIIAPDPRYVVEPGVARQELIVADLNLSEIDKEYMTLDVTGHYARPDVFKVELTQRPE